MPILKTPSVVIALANFERTWEPGWTVQQAHAVRTVDAGESLMDVRWAAGVTHAVPARVGSQRFLILVRSSGTATVRPVDLRGRPGDIRSTMSIRSGITSACSWRAGGKTWVFLFSSSTGLGSIHRLDAAGRLLPETHDIHWSTGSAHHRIVHLQGQPHFLTYTGSDGMAYLQALEDNGSIGVGVSAVMVGTGWSDVAVVSLGGHPSLLFYRASTGQVEVHRISSTGTIQPAAAHTASVGKTWTRMATWSPDHAGRLLLLDGVRGDLQFSYVRRGGQITGAIARRDWSVGWNTVATYEIRGGHYMILHKQATGRTVVHRLTERGVGRLLLGASDTGRFELRAIHSNRRISSTVDWSEDNGGAGWTVGEFLDVGPLTILLRLNAVTGAVRMDRLSRDGKPDRVILRSTWSSGWSHVTGFEQAGGAFVLLYSSQSGTANTHRLTETGAVGEQVDSTTWQPGWTTVRSFEVDEVPFLFLLRAADGLARIHRLLSDGRRGARVWEGSWSGGWDVAAFFPLGLQTMLFLLKSGSGTVHIHRMNPDGSLGSRTAAYGWSAGWDSAALYTVGTTAAVSLIKSGTGAGHQHIITASGMVGARVNPPEPFPVEAVRTSFTPGGKGLADYFADISRGRIHLSDTNLFGWITIPDSWESVKRRRRFLKGKAAVEAAVAAGLHPTRRDGATSWIVYHSDPGDSGASGRVALAHPSRRHGEFMAHEILHTWGVGHSFSDDRRQPSGWGDPLLWAEYDDPWDIMSANRAYGFDNGFDPNTGPGMNLFNLTQLGWLDEEVALLSPRQPAASHTIHTLSRRLIQPPLGLRIPIGGGDAYTVEYRTRVEWDRGIPADTVLIHRVVPTPTTGMKRWTGTWEPGWSTLHSYRRGRGTFLMQLSSSTGAVEIHRLAADGTATGRVTDTTWTTGWDTVTSYEVGGQSYVLLIKSGSGDVHLHRVSADGSMGPRILDTVWSSGWDVACTYRAGGETFLFLLKSSDGTGHQHRLNADGSIGAALTSLSWSTGWTHAAFFYRAGRTFVLLYSFGGGDAHIHRVNTDGTIGARVHSESWGPGYDSINAYGHFETYVLRARSSDGLLRVQSVGDNGRLAPPEKTQQKDWSSGWTHCRVVETVGGLCLLIYKSGTGEAQSLNMSRSRVMRQADRSPTQAVDDAVHGVSIRVVSTTADAAVISVG